MKRNFEQKSFCWWSADCFVRCSDSLIVWWWCKNRLKMMSGLCSNEKNSVLSLYRDHDDDDDGSARRKQSPDCTCHNSDAAEFNLIFNWLINSCLASWSNTLLLLLLLLLAFVLIVTTLASSMCSSFSAEYLFNFCTEKTNGKVKTYSFNFFRVYPRESCRELLPFEVEAFHIPHDTRRLLIPSNAAEWSHKRLWLCRGNIYIHIMMMMLMKLKCSNFILINFVLEVHNKLWKCVTDIATATATTPAADINNNFSRNSIYKQSTREMFARVISIYNFVIIYCPHHQIEE